ncbi:MAG: signal peptide peptidase SppA, partial [Bryobacterales bacterium]|nr:signal peptide peptidase SppA [Bryobacterales bacterium]
MKKFVIGLILGIVISVFAGFVIVLAMARLGDREPTVPDNTVLRLSLSGPIEEMAAPSFPLPGQPPSGLTTIEVWSALRKAAADSRVKAVVLEMRMPSMGWGTAQEIRGSLEKFKKDSGKPVYAYLRMPRMVDYYVASAADKIYASPEDLVLMQGMRLEIMYLKNTLDKVGVTMEVEHAGRYKDAGDQYTETKMTPETREVLTSLLDGLFNEFLTTAGGARNKSPEEMTAILDRGPFTAANAVKEGLFDGVRHDQQLKDEIKEELKLAEYKETDAKKYRAISPGSLGLTGSTSVAFVVAQGNIMRGKADSFTESSMIASESVAATLRSVAKNNDIKGVVLRIDSPGGDAVASDEILEVVRELSAKKPVVISMSNLAASGGYYMAMTGDPIVAYPSTITGSIGVVFTKPVLKGLYNNLGITKDSLSRGKNAGFLSDYDGLDAAGRANLKSLIQDMYGAFLNEVATGRKRPVEEIAPLAEGRVWLGNQALERGLLDELGGIDVALATLKKKAGIPDDDKLKVMVYPGKKSFF